MIRITYLSRTVFEEKWDESDGVRVRFECDRCGERTRIREGLSRALDSLKEEGWGYDQESMELWCPECVAVPVEKPDDHTYYAGGIPENHPLRENRR